MLLDETGARGLVESLKSSDLTVKSMEESPRTERPKPPFTTSTMQQDAGSRLGWGAQITMRIAQRLYENGYITYMRTDSVNLSQQAVTAARNAAKALYGADHVADAPRTYVGKTKNAQEAHEAIRPTDFSVSQHNGKPEEDKLYALIWKLAIASQMADARLEKTTVTIDSSGSSELFVAKGEVITFDGFLKVYLEGTDEENDDEAKGLLPAMNSGDSIDRITIVATERFANHPPRYTEASLVKRLEELGIGRPSTYASTISVIQKRGYVEMPEREGRKRNYRVITLDGHDLTANTETENTGAEKNKLAPTDIGIVVNDFLIKHFDKICSFRNIIIKNVTDCWNVQASCGYITCN